MTPQQNALEKLQAQLGQELAVGNWLEITQERIDQFANATGDLQWIHTDPTRAQAGPFGKTIAHGFLTLSLIPYLTGAATGGISAIPGAKLAINYGLNRVRFPHPVPCGARIRARTKLLSVTEVPGGLELVRQVTVEIEGAPKPGCVAESIARVYFQE